MADSKSLRQVAAQQANAAKQRQVKRPEEMDEQVVPAEGAEASAQPVAEAAPVAEASGGSSGSGPSYGLVGAGALGALGLIAAVAGGGGGKSGGATPPVAEIPKPDQPKPQEPKPEEPKPVEPKPEEPKTEQPQPVEPKPEEPKTEQPQPVEPKPEEPKTEQPQPVEPKPEEPKTEQPHPVEPKPEEPKTEQPHPVEPKPEEPKTEQPHPVEPKPEEPGPGQAVRPSAPIVRLVHDSGVSSNDRITNDATVQIDGLEAGATWRYCVDGGDWRAGSADNKIHQVESLAVDGGHQIKVQQISPSGAMSEVSDYQMTLDLEAPGKVSIATPSGKEISQNEVIRVGIEKDCSWEYRIDGSPEWMIGNRLGTFSVTGVPTAEHSHTVEFRQADAAGNVGDIFKWQFSLADSPPTVHLKNDSGESDCDRITNISTVVVGNVEDGGSWSYSLDGGKSWTTGDEGNEISGKEFGFDDGPKIVQVKRTGVDGSESERQTFEFNFQHSIVGTQGTDGANIFVLQPTKDEIIVLKGYNATEGDIVDIGRLVSQVVPEGDRYNFVTYKASSASGVTLLVNADGVGPAAYGADYQVYLSFTSAVLVTDGHSVWRV